MYPEFYQPALIGPALLPYNTTPADSDRRQAFELLPMNLSADEIRAMVREVLG